MNIPIEQVYGTVARTFWTMVDKAIMFKSTRSVKVGEEMILEDAEAVIERQGAIVNLSFQWQTSSSSVKYDANDSTLYFRLPDFDWAGNLHGKHFQRGLFWAEQLCEILAISPKFNKRYNSWKVYMAHSGNKIEGFYLHLLTDKGANIALASPFICFEGGNTTAIPKNPQRHYKSWKLR